jgi:hypothetical protein
VEGAFLSFEEEVMVPNFLQDLVYSLLVYNFVIFGSYNKVIHVDFQPSLHDFFSEDIVHHHLEGCWEVREAEEHHCWLE